MALYENGILISGANTLPQMTLAEYQALPVSERPTYWERTDGNYSNIPASDVTYGSGSVEDALDGLNEIIDFTSLITFDASISSYSAVKVGRVVNISFRSKASTISASTTLFTLPSEYVPYVVKNQLISADDTMYFALASYDNSVSSAQIGIRANGEVKVLGKNLPPYTGATISYIV